MSRQSGESIDAGRESVVTAFAAETLRLRVNCAQEAMAAEAAAARAPQHDEVDVEDLLDDPELEQLHRDRLLELQREAEKRAVMQQKGHGEYTVRRCRVLLQCHVSGRSDAIWPVMLSSGLEEQAEPACRLGMQQKSEALHAEDKPRSDVSRNPCSRTLAAKCHIYN